MAYSEIDVSECVMPTGETVVDITARGGTRRQRGAAIGAAARQYSGDLTRAHVRYSETYGFLSATYARYVRSR